MTRAWLDGEYILEADARVSAADRGFLLGDGAFETMRVHDGAVRRWARHRARLAGALDWLEIARPDFDALEAAGAELAARLNLEEAVLRLTVSRGALGGGLDGPSGARGTVLLTAKAPPPKRLSVSLVTAAHTRRAGLVSERFKLSNYAEPLAARRAARAAGADMGLMVSALDGSAVCADCANLFVVIDGAVATPPVSCGALPGTARAALLEAMAARGAPIAERTVSMSDLARAEAAFVTNAVMGAVPVRTLDGRGLDLEHAAVRLAVETEAGAD
ncbi:MAG: aminotransferase class IV [Oceanicaulis sp.]